MGARLTCVEFTVKPQPRVNPQGLKLREIRPLCLCLAYNSEYSLSANTRLQASSQLFPILNKTIPQARGCAAHAHRGVGNQPS